MSKPRDIKLGFGQSQITPIKPRTQRIPPKLSPISNKPVVGRYGGNLPPDLIIDNLNWKDEARKFFNGQVDNGKTVGGFLMQWKSRYDIAVVTLTIMVLLFAVIYAILLNVYEDKPLVKKRIQTWYYVMWGEQGTPGVFYELLKQLFILVFILLLISRVERVIRLYIARLSNS
jgi:hypothetical protein